MSPKVVIPHHYDIWPTILKSRPNEVREFPAEVQPVDPDNVIAKMMPHVSRKLADGGMEASYFAPEHQAWYHYNRITQQVEFGKCKRDWG